MILRNLFRAAWSPDIAVDLGTATARVTRAAGGHVLAAPSALGALRALRGGAVADPRCATDVLRPLLRRACGSRLGRPRALACFPSDASREEREALVAVVRGAGAGAVALIPEPVAAAVGAGMDLSSPYAQLVIDIGHGVTDCAVFRSGLIVHSAARRVGCGDLEDAARAFVRARHALEIGTREAQWLLARLCFDPHVHGAGTATVAGRTNGAGEPARAEVDLAQLAAALSALHDSILAVVWQLLRALPDEPGAQLVENGVRLTGGGALLPGMAASIARRTGLAVRVVHDPLGAVVRGARRIVPTVERLGDWR